MTLGFFIPASTELVDMTCICGTRFTEIGGAVMLEAMLTHECVEGELLALQAREAGSVSAAIEIMLKRWKRLA